MADEQRFLEGRTRSRRWVRVSHGLFVPVDDEGEGHLHALASRLHEDGGFTHLTAARLRGWWLPPLPPGVPEFAAQSDLRNRPRREELRIIRTTPEPVVSRLRGLPIVPPTEVLLALARHFGLLDVVVLLDAALHTGDVTWDELGRALAGRRHGVRRLRQAAALANGRSESPYETLLRLLHVVCDIAVVPQHELWVEGRLVARGGDLRLDGCEVFHEYDGADHRKCDQHRSDLGRDRDIVAAGWVRRGYTDREVLRRPIAILKDVDRSLGRLMRGPPDAWAGHQLAYRRRGWVDLRVGSGPVSPGAHRPPPVSAEPRGDRRTGRAGRSP